MVRLSRAPIWLLLVPYFAIASLNAPPWIGETRQHANRTNAQLTLALILVSPVVFAVAATGYLQRGLPRDHPTIFALIVYLPAVLFIGAWLKGDREANYRREYAQLPLIVRTGFGLATAALMVAGSAFAWSLASVCFPPKADISVPTPHTRRIGAPLRCLSMAPALTNCSCPTARKPSPRPSR
jgi:uncharacterized membrane protein YfcA